MLSSNFGDFVHCASRICLGQDVKALVWRWRQICRLKINYLHPKCTDIKKRGIYFQVGYRGMFCKSFRIDSRYILIASDDQIWILFFWHPVFFFLFAFIFRILHFNFNQLFQVKNGVARSTYWFVLLRI